MIKQKEEESFSEFMARNLSYYVEDPSRRCSDGACYYSPKKVDHKTEGCFVGRLLTPEFQEDFDACPSDTNIGDIIYQAENDFDWDVQLEDIPEVIRENVDTMAAFQTLHDNNHNWHQEKGLTDRGKENLKHIIQELGLVLKPFKKFL